MRRRQSCLRDCIITGDFSVKSLELGTKSSKIGEDDLLERYEVLEDTDTGKWGVFTQGGEDIAEGFKSEKEATDWILANMGEDQQQKFHSVDVTEAMRESVMQGQPMFKKAVGNGEQAIDGKSKSLESTPIIEEIGRAHV